MIAFSSRCFFFLNHLARETDPLSQHHQTNPPKQTHRYSALREAAPHGAWGAALIDTRQQSAVVRELSKLANASNAGNVEVRLGVGVVILCLVEWV